MLRFDQYRPSHIPQSAFHAFYTPSSKLKPMTFYVVLVPHLEYGRKSETYFRR